MQELTQTQQALLDHVRSGKVITRSKESLPGKGYFSEGLRGLMPSTVKTLIDLQLVQMIDETEDEQIFGIETDADVEPEQVQETKVNAQPEITNDYLMWVGSASYPTIQSFVDESEAFGVSKRLSRLPKDIKPGSTRIFLAHDEGQIGSGVIFGYFVVTGIEVIAPEEDKARIADLYQGRQDVTYVNPIEQQTKRECGYREDPGAIYVISYISPDTLVNVPAGCQLHGPLVVFDRPIEYSSVRGKNRRFRSFAKVDGNEIMSSGVRVELSPQAKALQEQMPEELAALTSGTTGKWSDEERAALKKLVDRIGEVNQAIKTFSLYTGRSRAGVAYQWYNHVRQEEI